ncbi:ras-related protein Rab-44 isoform X3 [Eretmochelys imbricata]
MEEQRRPRKLGSSRRKQLRDVFGGAKTSPILEEEPFSPEIMEKIQDFFQECDKDQKGFITRADMQKLKKEDFPCSAEELELVFDGLDTDRNGYLTTEEFTTGLEQFLSLQTTTRQHRRRKTASRRVYMSRTDYSLEEADSEERKCFRAFMDQLGADNIFEDQSEIWRLWVKLRQDEPHLLGNLEEFLAKMTLRIKEAQSEKVTLELTLNKRVTDHNREVQQLYEEMEQQINREKQRLQHELETQFHSLSTKQHAATSENQRLKENNQDLENQLQQIHIQLQETQGHLGAMRGRVSQPHSEEGSAPYGISFASDLGHRTRVISTEEDLFTEFMKKGEAFFQQEFSGQSSLLSELNNAIAALDNVSEPQVPGTDDLLYGDASLHPARQGGDSKQRIKQVRDSEHQVLSRNDNEPKALSEALSVLSTNQATSQGETLKQGPTQAEPHAQDAKQAPASEPATHNEAPNLRKKEIVYAEVQPPAVSEPARQATIPKQNPPEGGVLLPSVSQPGITEQAAPDEIQKWVPMKRDVVLADVWPPAVSEQALLKEKPPETKAPEKKTFEQREPPKQETPPTYLPHEGALHKEGVENEQGGALLRASQLRDTPQAKTQPQSTEKPEATRAEETRGDRDIFQQEKKQVSSVKANEDAIPKLGGQGYQGNVTPEQPGGTAKGTKETCTDPDHLYNVLFVGDSNVGKTSFLYRLHEDSFNPSLTATIGMDYRVKNLFVDNKCFALRLWDTAGQERYHSITKQFFRKADGVVLMYDVTSEYSFADVRYWLSCIQEGAGDGIVILLLGNKSDCAAERQVSTEEGGRLAKECELLFYECSAASGHKVSESMIDLARSLKTHEDRLKAEMVEVPVPPKKKRGLTRQIPLQRCRTNAVMRADQTSAPPLLPLMQEAERAPPDFQISE